MRLKSMEETTIYADTTTPKAIKMAEIVRNATRESLFFNLYNYFYKASASKILRC